MAQELLAKFHATNPNVHVFYTPDPDNLDEKMVADFQAGTAADVISGCCDFFPAWAQQGFLLDLRPYVEADIDQATIADWDVAQYEAFFTSDGVQYALPKYHGALGLFYNKDLFDEYNVEYPDRSWSYSDYLTAMKALTKDRDGDHRMDLWGSMLDPTWDRLQVHVNGWGGHFVDPEDPQRCLMGEPKALEAFSWIRERMWDDKVMATFLDVQNRETRQAFIDQQVAMVEDGSWALKDILELAPFRVGVTAFPAGPERRATLATTDGYAIFAGTRHPEAAWELIKFLTSQEYGRAMAQAHLLQPARSSLVDEWVDMVRAAYPRQTEDMDIASFATSHTDGFSVTAEVFPNMSEARRLASQAWKRIYTLGQSPVSLMQEVAQEIEQAQRVST
jgi:multiple sugar transport system substrate-binding protein